MARIGRTRRSRRAERGAQSLEWIGLGSFVMALMAGAATYANAHLGSGLGDLLLNHIKAAVGQ
jgi:hypothetical protein